MTDQPTPLSDEDLSAYLDGEVDDDLAARIESDPAAQDRLTDLRAASSVLAAHDVAPLAPGVVDDLVANALAAADQVAEGDDDAEVHPLAPPRPARRVPSWLVAAVVVVLMGIGLAFVWSGTHSKTSSTSDLATSAEERSTQAKAADSAAAGGDDASSSAANPGASGSGHGAPATTVTPSASVAADTTVVALGSFPTAAALRSSLARAFPSEPAVTKPAVTTAALDRCAGLLQQILPVAGGPTHVGVATVAGKTVAVYEFAEAPDATTSGSSTTVPRATTLTVGVHPAACDQVLAFQR